MHLMYDQAKQKWALYRRIIPEFSERMIADESDRERQAVDRYYRSYAYAESDDLREWKNHQFILSMDADDPGDTELYQFACHKFGQIYVGYMSVFYLRYPQAVNIHLATSRDGLHFSRVCRGEPFIPSGPLGYYDYMAMACSQPEPIIVDDTMYIYYVAANFPHNVDTDQHSSRHPQMRRGAGHAQARPVCVPGNERSQSRAVPRGDQALYRAAPQAVPERRHLDEGIDPCRGIDARLAADSGLHGTPGACDPGRRPRPSRPVAGQRRREQADRQGDSPQILHDPGANPRADTEQRRQKARSGRQPNTRTIHAETRLPGSTEHQAGNNFLTSTTNFGSGGEGIFGRRVPFVAAWPCSARPASTRATFARVCRSVIP